MTAAEQAQAIAKMQAKRIVRTEPVFQMNDGSWSHAKTVHGGFADKETAQIDYRFCCEWE